MTKATHTPGPWVVEVDESAAQVKGYPCIYADGYAVVGTEGMFGDIDIDFANARLIAAAPDMLEALEAATECGLIPKSSVRDGGASSHPRQVVVADMIRAAIAKARGEA